MENEKLPEYFRDEPAPMQEKQWVRRVRENSDRSAFENIFKSYYKQLHGYAYTFVKCREDSEDIVQTIFMKIWSNRETWNPPGQLKHYLFLAIRNEALNYIRHQKVISNSEEQILELYKGLNQPSKPEGALDQETLQQAIQTEIDSLPAKCREIYLLNRRSGLSYIEIAKYLNLSINTVGTQMGRALKMLREGLSDYLPYFIASPISKLFF